MKRLPVLLIFFIFFSRVSFAQVFKTAGGNFSLSIEPVIGYTTGVLNESIYHSKDKSKKISLLEWDKKLWMYGAKIDSAWKGLHLTGSLEAGIPEKSGRMQDSDWLNTLDYNMKTTYSVGTNHAVENYDINAGLFYEWQVSDGIYLVPKLQAQYSFDSFSRKKNAEGWYGQSETSLDGQNHWWYESEAKHYPTEYYWNPEKGRYVRQILAGIEYFRHTVNIWAGMDVQMKAGKVKGMVGAAVSPFTYYSAQDTHHGAGGDNIYHEIQQGNFCSTKLNMALEWEISRIFTVKLEGQHISGREIKGDLYEGWSKNKRQPSGASQQELKAELSVKIRMM